MKCFVFICHPSSITQTLTIKMPEPIAIARPQEFQRPVIDSFDLSALFFSLSPCTEFIHKGIRYVLNMTEYNSRISNARTARHQCLNDYQNEIITHDEFQRQMDEFMTSIATYEVIDEHEKVCGIYNNMSKTLQIFLRQVTVDGVVYYCDDVDRNLYTYVGSSVGILSDDESEIISYDSQSDYMYLPTYVPRD